MRARCGRKNSFGARFYGLNDEVKTRCNNLISQCTIDLSELDDYQLLQFKKSMVNFLNEKSLVLEKVTSFSKFQPEHQKQMSEICDLRDKSVAIFSKLTNDLQEVLKCSEEKLKLKIIFPNLKVVILCMIFTLSVQNSKINLASSATKVMVRLFET